jgi:ankyrin repeat protein
VSANIESPSEILASVQSVKQTWKSVISALSNSLHISPDRLVLSSLRNKDSRVLFPFHQVSEAISICWEPGTGTFESPGDFYYEIAPDRLTIGSSKLSAIDERFSDSEAGRKAFFNGLSRSQATALLRLQDDVLENVSSSNLRFLMHYLIRRISKELLFGANDSLQVTGIKHVISSVLVSLCAPTVFALFQKSFFLLKTWSAFHTWISQEAGLWKQPTWDETRRDLNKCIVSFLISQPTLVESIVSISHDFCQILRCGSSAKIQGVFGPVFLVSPVQIFENSENWIFVTLGFIYIVQGRVFSDKMAMFPNVWTVDISRHKLLAALPIGLWQVLPIPDGVNEARALLIDGAKNVIELHLPDKQAVLNMLIVYELCKMQLEGQRFQPFDVPGCVVRTMTGEQKIYCTIKLDDHSWQKVLSFEDITRVLSSFMTSFRPSVECSARPELHLKPGHPYKQLADVACGGDGCMGQLPEIYASILYDLLVSSDARVRFSGLRLLRVSDFAYPIEINSEALLKKQIKHFHENLDDFCVTGTPLLHYASLVCGDPGMMRLICSRVKINAVDHPVTRRSAVFYALRNRNMAILQVLIDAGIDLDLCDAELRSPLTYALSMGDKPRAKFLMENGASVHLSLSEKYISALELAINLKDSEMLELILPYVGGQINYPNHSGLFPLHCCIANGFRNGIRLIEFHCPNFNPNLCTDSYSHCLHYAVDHPSPEFSDSDGFAVLLSLKNLDINVVNSDGQTPLIRATIAGRRWMVEMLASDPRCDLNCYSREGMTALSYAVKASDDGCVRALLSSGAFPDQPNANGETPLFIAVGLKDLEIVRMLMEGGAEPDRWYYKGQLVVHIAEGEILAYFGEKGYSRYAVSFCQS